MKLFDLHCDTATRLLDEKQNLYDNSLHVSLKRAEYLEKYIQVMAVWTNKNISDEEGFLRFFEVVKNLETETGNIESIAHIVKNSMELANCINTGRVPLILGVEDARILSNDIERLSILSSFGVKVLTLNWYGKTCIGGGHDTHIGLSNFGIRVVKQCFELGIIPDISHCSFEGAKMTLDLAIEHHKPIIASHSDAYSISSHTRNLKDDDFKKIIGLEGLVGINLCPEHLSSNANVGVGDVIKHIEHYLSLGGEKVLAMGCDLDGTNLPAGINGIEDIYKIANEMQRLNYSTDLVDDIMYNNAFNFFVRNI